MPRARPTPPAKLKKPTNTPSRLPTNNTGAKDTSTINIPTEHHANNTEPACGPVRKEDEGGDAAYERYKIILDLFDSNEDWNPVGPSGDFRTAVSKFLDKHCTMCTPAIDYKNLDTVILEGNTILNLILTYKRKKNPQARLNSFVQRRDFFRWVMEEYKDLYNQTKRDDGYSVLDLAIQRTKRVNLAEGLMQDTHEYIELFVEMYPKKTAELLKPITGKNTWQTQLIHELMTILLPEIRLVHEVKVHPGELLPCEIPCNLPRGGSTAPRPATSSTTLSKRKSLARSLLADLDETTVMQQDQDGNTVLHLAVGYHAMSDGDSKSDAELLLGIEKLAKICPEALRVVNKAKESPYQYRVSTYYKTQDKPQDEPHESSKLPLSDDMVTQFLKDIYMHFPLHDETIRYLHGDVQGNYKPTLIFPDIL